MIVTQKYVTEVTLLEEQDWESDCKDRELSLQLRARSLVSRLFLINVQCVFKACQHSCLSSIPSSLSLGFPSPTSIKLFSVISEVFPAVSTCCSLSYLLHMW